MAKTKGSNPPYNEFSYRDADGTDHFLGEFIRSIFGEGSISRYDPSVDNTGISRRGLRPTQQGAGSVDQKQYRDNFLDCIALWNSLPEECPAPLPDPPPTSKSSVWEAKLEHGVVCSYFDLFLRCCLNWANSHGNNMPDGDCFPCVDLCECGNCYIEYTTQGMQASEQQTLSVGNAVGGCTYQWNISSGGGSLSAEDGLSVVFTAASTNPSCVNNATITLSVNEVVCDSLQIAVNAHTGAAVAFKILECRTAFHGYCVMRRCDGTIYSESLCCVGNETSPCVSWCPVATGWSMTPVDIRTPAMIEAGCCPEELL